MKRGLAAAVALAALLPSSALAATTVGSSLRQRANLYARCNTTCSAVQSARPGGAGLTIPSDGVITRWRVRAATLGQVRLRVVRREDDGGYTAIATTDWVELDRSHRPGQDVLYEFPARISVQAGDTIGLDRDAKAGGIFHSYSTNSAYAVADFLPRLPDDASDVQPQQSSTGRELLLNADVEKDSDGDGFGDETQDNCPTVPNDQSDKPCTTPPPNPTSTAAPGPTATPIDNTTPQQHNQGSEGPPVPGERAIFKGTHRHTPRRGARPTPPRPSDPLRAHDGRPPARPGPPPPSGPSSDAHDNSPSVRPRPPHPSAPESETHATGPTPRQRPVAHHRPTSRHDISRSPRPRPPATEPQTAQPHDQSESPRPSPNVKRHARTRRHGRRRTRPAPPPAAGAPGWQHH